MSIFSAPSFYAAPDRQTYSAGNYFIPQEKYTFGGVPRYLMPSGITATTAANAIPPILHINQGGGGDGGGGGIDTSAPEDQSTTADDFGFGLAGNDPSMNMTEEEKDAIDAYNNPPTTKGMLGTIGLTAFGFMNPISAIFSLAYQRNKAKEKAMEEAKEAAAKAETERQGMGFDFAGTGDYSGGRAGGGGFGGNTAGGFSESDPSATEGSHADGGRVGYMMGGLANLVDIYD